MAEAEDHVLGKIAIQMGLITPGQLEQLLKLSEEFRKPIGAIMMEQGAIDPNDMQRLIDLRKLSVSSEAAHPPRRQEALTLARQIVREGFLTPEEADECLRDHVIDGERRPFEEALVERGVVTKERIEQLKALREERPMHCPKCRLGFKVKSVSGRKTIECPKCKGALIEGRPSSVGLPPARVELKTAVMKAIEPDRPSKPAPGAKKIDCQCMICDALFKAARDANGRVKCPQCGTSFEPKADE